MKDRQWWLDGQLVAREFTTKIVREMIGAAFRNDGEADPHVATVWWNPNEWRMRADIKPGEDDRVWLSMTIRGQWRVIRMFGGRSLRSLNQDRLADMSNSVAEMLIELLKTLPEDER